MESFKGALCVVTGGGSGMGRELCLQLAAEGAHIATCDMNAESMEETKALCLAVNPRVTVTTCRCDVSQEAEVLAWRDEVAAEHDITRVALFNNAGIAGGQSFVADPRSQWELTFSVCWGGTYNCCRAFMPMLVASEQGAVINTSSINGFYGAHCATPHTAYASAKHAIKGFSEALIGDLRLNAPHVKAFCVMPGAIATDIVANSVILNPIPGKTPSPSLIERARAVNMDDPGAMSAADAAEVIINGVRRNKWRILVGEDAEFLDEKVRADPEAVTTKAFWDGVSAAGYWANSLSEKAVRARDAADAAAAEMDSGLDSFAGAVAVVTGGGAGMGRDLCTQLAAEGAHIAMCDMSDESMEETKALCLAANPSITVTTARCDVSNEAEVLAWRDEVAAEHDTARVALFNNAGLDAGGKPHDIAGIWVAFFSRWQLATSLRTGSFVADPRSQWELTFNVCWGGVYNCCRAFMPMLVASELGAVVNTASINGFFANIGMHRPHTAYCAAKFAVKGFTEALVTDLRANAPHVTAHCVIATGSPGVWVVLLEKVMPGIISTNIAANSIRWNPKPGRVPSEELLEKAAAAQKHMETTGHALPSADAAGIILDGARNGRWRILVGKDAEFIDEKVRGDPESAYGFSFWDDILEAGHLHRVEARARTERAREAHARGVAVAELGESARAAL